jgi:DNA invertase Pin-like site-specific DNA recombinase
MPTCYIYTRVSTTDQNLSPEWQANVCKVYYETSVAGKGYEFGGIFHDHGESAYSIDWRDRTEGRKLFNLVKPGDIIIVAKMCRAFRSTRDRENCLHFLGQVGIDIAILDCAMDTTTAAGKFAAGIIALQVQWESDVKSERMKAAHSIRRQQKRPMKKRPPPGWMLDKALDELVPDWDERRLLAQIYRMHGEGIQSLTSAAKSLKARGLKRASGDTYNSQWLHRAYVPFLKNFPLEGFAMKNRQSWRNEFNIGRFKASRPRAEQKLYLVGPRKPRSTSSVEPASQPSASQPDGC